MIGTVAARYVIGALTGIALLGIAAPPATAQQAGKPGVASAAGSSEAGRNRAGSAATTQSSKRTAAKKRATAPPRPNAVAPPTGAWTLDDALPKGSSAASERYATPTIDQFGRVPLQQGTFGLDTATRPKANELSDGRRIPGLEGETHKSPSYFGLSVTVPTDDKRLPLPIPPFFGRPE
jgi:hypothetical protein